MPPSPKGRFLFNRVIHYPGKLRHSRPANRTRSGIHSVSEPGRPYREAVTAFYDELARCTDASNRLAGIPSPTSQHYWGSVLFTALCNRSMSLLVLVPQSPVATKRIENWDYAAAAMLTRALLEMRLAFYYLCIEPRSEDEHSCRQNLVHLNDCENRRLMFADQDPAHSEVEKLAESAEMLRNRLRANSFFTALPDGRQRSLLNGQTPFLQTFEVIAEKCGTPLETFRWLYKFLSNHSHGWPMAFHRIGEERGRGVRTDAEEGYTTMLLTFGRELLAETRAEYEALFDGFARST
jgi:hypothetical protein